MIVESFPPELERFVAEQAAAGNYKSKQDVVVSAVRTLRELQASQQRFYEDVRLGIQQLESGDVIEYDEPGLRTRFEELKQRAVNRGESERGDS
jgi:Arc/MetJ-type ribon-helix-helix transcriptional regulator